MKGKTTLIVAGLLFIFGIIVADTSVSTSANLQLFPKAAHPEGGGHIFAYVSNKDYQDFEIYTRAFDSNLGNGSSEIYISRPSPADGHRLHAEAIPSIKSTDKGALVAWVNHKDGNIWALRVTSTGIIDSTFNNANMRLVHPATFMTPPQMCSDGAGGAYFVWVESSDLKVTRILSSGSPATGFPQTVAAGSLTLPRICADDGGAMVAWVEDID